MSDRSRSPDPEPFAYAGTELDAMAMAPNYYRAILRTFAPHLGAHTVEVGAGVGTFARFLATDPAIQALTLIEPDPVHFAVLRDRFAADPRISTRQGFLGDHADALRADAMVLVNVLEHVQEDGDFLRSAAEVLRGGGRLLVFVPALPALFGSLDRAFDHHRRYTRAGLREALTTAGFEIRLLRYTNLPGVIAWWVAGRVLRKTGLSSREVGLYDRLVVPGVAAVERVLPPPLGQSLIAVATAP